MSTTLPLRPASPVAGRSPAPTDKPVVPRPPIWLRYRMVLAAALVAGILTGLIGHSFLPVGLVPVLAGALLSRARRAERRRQAAAQCSAVVALCAALRAELEGGALPHGALLEAVWCRTELRDLAEQIGAPGRIPIAAGPGSTADVLAAAALAAPGRDGLSGLAACWRATEEHGLPLAGAVAGIEGALRAEEQRQLVLDAELSGIRTTMGLLAVLPVFGLLLGSGLGIQPWRILLQTFGGQTCLVFGCALDLVGLWWTDRLVAGVTDLGVPRRQRRPRSSWRVLPEANRS